MRGKVSHMVAVHGAALVAPYGGMSVGVAVVLPPSPLGGEGLGMRGRLLWLTEKKREANASLSL